MRSKRKSPVPREASTAELRGLLTTRAAAEALGTTEGRLRTGRHDGSVPLAYVKCGRSVRYNPADIETYIADHTVTPKGQAA